MKPFDVQNVPLEGVNLIEAAAGTGKTYSIEQLFVRIILEKAVRVEEILVVTFTQAAAAELQDRIHTRLIAARDELVRAAGDRRPDGPLSSEKPALRLGQAIMDFDRAAIFTIHGFCQRLLHEHAFETGIPFDSELIPDQTPILREICEDFWRMNIGEAPLELTAYALGRLKGPEHLLAFLYKIKSPAARIIPATEEIRLTHLQAYREALEGLRGAWPSLAAEAMGLLEDPGLNASVYGTLTSNGGGGLTKRQRVLAALREAMESFLAPGSPPFPQLPGLEKLTSGYLAEKTRRGRIPPRHPLFDLCQEVFSEARGLEDEMAAWERHFKTRLIHFADLQLRRRKRERNVQSFDDLLLAVSRALSSTQGGALAEVVRRRYRAVLVDEFQDTDDLQYSIFSRLFVQDRSCLFWIGDPKQAIYGFRGADIFSYLKAARSAHAAYTLTENWRSTESLVTAVNALFSGSASPFLFPEIGFAPGRAARGEAGERAPFTLWLMDSRRFREDGGAITKTEAEPIIARAVAAEIARLVRTEGEGIPAGDIAVLVRTNDQARIVKEHLASAGIPAVVCSTGSIFDSAEAEEMQRILLSICEPGNTGRLKAALATDLLGATADEIEGHDPDSDWWEAHYGRQRMYFERWERDGFMPMFGFLMDQERIKERLLGFEDGERRLTNVLHLAELLHQAGAEGRLGMAALVRWLALQREPSTPGRDEHLLRLESDAHAVQIATIHKSKGLEYRVVFCPYAWSGSTVGGGEVFFHDPSAGFRLTIDLNAPDQGASRAAAENELLSENLRLLYVALTRARERCYLVWGNIRAAETSAMAYLFHGADLPAPAAAADGASVPRLLLESIRSKTEEDLAADLQRLVQRSRGSIETRPLPEAAEVPAQQIASRAPDQLFSRRFCGSIDRSWRTASYSRLVAAADFDADLPDRDSPLLSASPAGPPEEGPSPEASRRDRFSFPTGSRAGNFFHSVLEAVDFRNPPHPDNKAVIEQKLAEFGYEEAWRETVLRIVAEIAAAALFPGAPGLTLSRLNPGERIHEMEFYHPLRLITPETLRDAFEPCGLRDALAGFPERLGRLVFSPTRGFMKGYIDMVAGHAGRFFLVDWKSNHLGDRPEDYHAGRLLPPMQDGYYILQYHLYCLALHLYLGRRLPDYDYRRHFGGVAYVFIRGVDGSRGPDYGIYRDRPEPDIIHALGKALLPCYE